MAGRDIKAGGAYVELYVKSQRFLRGLKAANARLAAFGAGAQNLGMRMLATAGVMAAPFALATRTFMGFEQQMAKVRGITKANDTDFERLSEKAKELGRTTSFSASEAAQGMEYLGMAGYNTEQILAGLPAVLTLAKAGSVDLAVAADIASDVGSAFRLSADEIDRVADVMATTATSANTNVEMMGETFQYAAPLAAAAGQSIETTAAAAGVLGNNGIKASSAGTDLANILKRISETGVQQKLRDIGVETVGADGNLRNMTDVMRDLDAATSEMGGAEKLGLFSQLFGRSAKSVAVLTSQSKDMAGLEEKLKSSSGAAQEMAETMDNTLTGAFTRLMSSVEAVQIAIGEALAGAIGDVVEWITPTIQSLSEWIGENEEVVQTIAAITVAVAAAGAGLVVFGTIASSAAAIVSAALGVVTAAVTVLTTAVSVLTGVITFLLSPIGLVVAAIAGLGAVALAAAWETGAAFDGLGAVFGEIKEVFDATVGGIIDALRAGELELAARIAWLGLQIMWKQGTAWLYDVWRYFYDGFVNAVVNMSVWTTKTFSEMWNGIKVMWTSVTGWLQQVFLDFLSWFIGMINTVLVPQLRQAAKAAEFIPGVQSKAIHQIAEAFEGAPEVLSDAARDTTKRTERDLEALAKERRDTLKGLESFRRASVEGREADRRRQREIAEKEIARLRDELDAATKKASYERRLAEAEEIDDFSRGGMAKFAALQAGIARAAATQPAAGVEAASRRVDIAGTFSADAASRLGGRTMDRVAKATEKTAENTMFTAKYLQRVRTALIHGGTWGS